MKSLPVLLLLTLLAPCVFAQDQREWKDTQGRTIEATYLAVEGDAVKLKLSSGKTSLVPLAKLSEADRHWVKERQSPRKPVAPATTSPGLIADPRATLEDIAKATNWAPLTDLGDKLPPGVTPPPPSDEQAIIPLRLDGRSFFIRADGSEAFPQHKFNTTTPFREDLAWVSMGELKGFINREGNFVIGGDSKVPLPEGCNHCDGFSDGRALFHAKAGVGYIDKAGAVVIPAGTFKRGGNFSEGLAAVSTEPAPLRSDLSGSGGWQYINTAGEVVIRGPYTWPGSYFSGIARVRTDLTDIQGKGPVALIGRTGERLLQSADRWELGTLCGTYTTAGGKVVDMKGNAILTVRTADYNILLIESKIPVAIARYEKAAGSRMIHLPSKSVYGPVIAGTPYFVEGFAAVSVGSGKNPWGCIDLSGHLVIPPAFSKSPEFKDGYALTTRFVGEQGDAEQFVVINRTGKIIWQGEPKKKS